MDSLTIVDSYVKIGDMEDYKTIKIETRLAERLMRSGDPFKSLRKKVIECMEGYLDKNGFRSESEKINFRYETRDKSSVFTDLGEFIEYVSGLEAKNIFLQKSVCEMEYSDRAYKAMWAMHEAPTFKGIQAICDKFIESEGFNSLVDKCARNFT